MKKVYLFVFIAVLAVLMIVICVMSFNPAADKWSSFISGAALGLLIVLAPYALKRFKNKGGNKTKSGNAL